MNLQSVAQELILALRGRRSQTAFSRRLGYKSNVAYAWESGRRAPTAAEALRAASRVGVDVRAAVRRFYQADPPWLAEQDPATPAGVAAWLRDLRGDIPRVRVAQASGLSRYAVARALSGEAEPRLADFLRLVEAMSARALDLVATLVDPSQLPSARARWRHLQAQRRLAVEQPYTQAVLRAVELVDYQALPRHLDGWIAARLGLSPEIEAACLDLLAHAGELRWDGQRWRPAGAQAVDTRSDPAHSRQLKAWWAKVGLDRLGQDPDGLWSYNVISVSEADLHHIRELHLAYVRAVRAIVAESAPAERVAVLNVQCFALDVPSPTIGHTPIQSSDG